MFTDGGQTVGKGLINTDTTLHLFRTETNFYATVYVFITLIRNCYKNGVLFMFVKNRPRQEDSKHDCEVTMGYRVKFYLC